MAWSGSGRQAAHPPLLRSDRTVEGEAQTQMLRKPFDVLARAMGAEVVSHEVPSWNQVRDWLRELESLRQASLNSPRNGSEAS